MGELNPIILQASSEPPAEVKINLPAGKSMSNRGAIIAALSQGSVVVNNPSTADDAILLEAALTTKWSDLWMGDAGTALRFGTAWAAVSPGERILRGSSRLSERPISPLVDALRKFGADIAYAEKEGFAPLKVKGKKLTGGKIKVDGSLSSQFVSALLLVAPYFSEGLELELDKAQVSMPYIPMTVNMMRAAGAEILFKDGFIKVEPVPYGAADLEVEPDWSAAAFFYTWALCLPNSRIVLKSLPNKSFQGDRIAVELFGELGVKTNFTPSGAVLEYTGVSSDKSSFDFVNMPDLAQPFAVAAAVLKKPVKLTGLQTLKYKETDRIVALEKELAKCGVISSSGADFLELQGFSEPQSMPAIEVYKDHRMAMAFAPMVRVFGEIKMNSPHVVAKSFPGYWEEITKFGITAFKT